MMVTNFAEMIAEYEDVLKPVMERPILENVKKDY